MMTEESVTWVKRDQMWRYNFPDNPDEQEDVTTADDLLGACTNRQEGT